MEDWRRDYNEVRPHSAIGDLPPITLINRVGAPARRREKTAKNLSQRGPRFGGGSEAGKIYLPVRANWGAVESWEAVDLHHAA